MITKTLLPLLCLSLASQLSISLAQETPATQKYVLLISVDGMRPDAIEVLGEEKAPNLHRIKKEGASTNNARTDATYTVTLPNHTAMITGRGVVGDAGHNWVSNGDPKLGQNLHRNKKSYLASMFGVAHDNELSTALYASKSKFSLYDDSYSERWGAPDTTGEDNGKDKIDTYLRNDVTTELVEALTEQLRTNPAPLTMVHLRDPDTSGHANGWILEGDTPYLQAIQQVDTLIGLIFDAIEENDATRGNTWVIVTADHGGGGNGQEINSHTKSKLSDNYTIPFFVWGPGVKSGGNLYEMNKLTRVDPGKRNPAYEEAGQPVRNGDAGNLALSLLGLPAIPDSMINAKQDLSVK